MKTKVNIEHSCLADHAELGKLYNHLANVVEFDLNLIEARRYLDVNVNLDLFMIYSGGSHIAIIEQNTTQRLAIITEK